MRQTAWLALALPLALASCATPPAPQSHAVTVTGLTRSVNGAATVPIGLFGVHATALDEKKVADWGIESVRLIDQNPQGIPVTPGSRPNIPANIHHIVECFYDRYQPARLLVDKNWKENLEKLARTYAQNAKSTNFPHVIEFWNEPFLNWATRPGVNYDPAYYESAHPQLDQPMTLKGHDQPTEYLVWTKKLQAVDARGHVDYLASAYIPQVYTLDGKPYEPPPRPTTRPTTRPIETRKSKMENRRGPATRPVKDGDTFIFRNTRPMTVKELWWGRDITQKSYFSAKQNSLYYRQMLLPFAKAIKDTNPAVQVLAGWGCHMSMGNWSMWTDNYQPAIDAAWPYLDGIHEHHYGGDTRTVAGFYELAYAYGLTRYHKPLVSYNTEAGGMLDPERPDSGAKPNFEPKKPSEYLGTMTYALRDILYMLAICPDKAMARAAHGAHFGDEIAFKFLKDLRGALVYTVSDDPNVWCVAATTPTGQLTVVVFNDNTHKVAVPLTVHQQAGGFTSAVQTRIVATKDDLKLVDTLLTIPLGAESWTGTLDLAPKAAAKLAFTTAAFVGTRPGAEDVVETQHFSTSLMTRVDKGQKITLTIDVPESARTAATAARLKLFQQGLSPKGITMTFNGHPLDLHALTGPITQWNLSPAQLRPTNTLTFACTSSAKPFLIPVVSLITLTGRDTSPPATNPATEPATAPAANPAAERRQDNGPTRERGVTRTYKNP